MLAYPPFVSCVGALGIALLGVHQAVTLLRSLLVRVGGQGVEDYLYSPAVGLIVTYVEVVIGFGVLVMHFGRQRVRVRYVLGGATLFFGLGGLAQRAFGIYLDSVAELSTIYGSLSTVLVFILWIYYSIFLLLFSSLFLHVLIEDVQCNSPPSVDETMC